MVPVEYGTFAQTFHLKTWLFKFINGITFKWGYILWNIIDILEWIVLLTKLMIY